MIKNVRNAFHHYKTFIDHEGKTVHWKHIQQLVSIQRKEGLHCGNKLTPNHIDFLPQKMKVNLAVQVFSESGASSSDYCRNLKIDNLIENEGTARCLRIFDKGFDVLNSRTTHGKYSKSP